MPKYKDGKKHHLNYNQEQFCLNVVNGMSYVDAYASVYGEGKTRETTRSMGKQLAQKPEVAKRIQDLRDRMAYKLMWSRAEAEKSLRDVLNMCIDKEDAQNAIKAIMELNRMCGYHAPTTSINATVDIKSNDIDSIMKNLGFVRTEKLTDGQG